MVRRGLRLVVAGVAVLVLLRVVAVDRWLPDGLVWGVVPLLALVPWACVVAAVLAVAAAVMRHVQEALAAAVVLAVGLLLVLPRAVASDQPARSGEDRQVVVALLNLKTGLADASATVAAARQHDVDVLVTQELTVAVVRRLHAAGLQDLLPHEELRPSGRQAGGGVHSALPMEVADDGASGTPDVHVEVAQGTALEVTTLHPVPPVGPRRTGLWLDALRQLPSPSGQRPAVVVGDFNATLDHAALRDVLGRGWRDAAATTGDGLVPTWNPLGVDTPAPPLTIDHILLGPGVTVADMAIVPIASTDHRMLVARLHVAPGSPR